ncbi:hypothetical protein PSE_p0033 (plasmid) [Pseudovibrio sp. FO-BEG1]|uniref:hypothetical protein n=1 Tax=Pseudovibrio sp. (strain FO-BEG1) TaxID=911045 RepID=UPI000238C60A|nr:hypothetical protein [Pseudovibrio sp. FO-BEG1]AEV39615.1 hypothetical protein PSE_p0033 [Pseudovibrio sp. FO-BEG1]
MTGSNLSVSNSQPPAPQPNVAQYADVVPPKPSERIVEYSLNYVTKKTAQHEAVLGEIKRELNSYFSTEVTEKVVDHFLSTKPHLPKSSVLATLLHVPSKASQQAQEKVAALFEEAHAYGTRLTLETFFEGAAIPDDPKKAAEVLTARIVELAKTADADGISSLVRSLSFLGGSDDAVLKEAVPIALKAVHSTLVYPESVRTQNAAQGGEVARVPGEVTTHLLALIRDEAQSPDLDPATADLLAEVDGYVKDQVLGHRISVPETRELLTVVGDRLEEIGFKNLADQTKVLQSQLGKSDNPPLTRLHDAIYSRVLDSTFIADLVEDTPQPVMDSAQLVKDGLRDVISIQTPRVQNQTAMTMHKMMAGNERFWMPECPELMEFVQGPRQDALTNLDKFLSAPTRNGYDAIAVPMLVVKGTVALHALLTKTVPEDRQPLVMNGKKVADLPAYVKVANKAYQGICKEANRTNAPEDPDLKREDRPKVGRTDTPKSAHAGITLGYQPGSVTFEGDPDKIPSTHPADVNLPKLQEPSKSQVEALSRGIPFASGVSGSTNLNLHFLHYLRHTSPNPDLIPDSKDYMVANTMFLNFDGGHSIHEALWVGQELDGTLGLDLGLARAKPDGTQIESSSYVSDLNEFIELYDGTETGEALERAKESAFDATLDYFDEHSYAAGKTVGEA